MYIHVLHYFLSNKLWFLDIRVLLLDHILVLIKYGAPLFRKTHFFLLYNAALFDLNRNISCKVMQLDVSLC